MVYYTAERHICCVVNASLTVSLKSKLDLNTKISAIFSAFNDCK